MVVLLRVCGDHKILSKTSKKLICIINGCSSKVFWFYLMMFCLPLNPKIIHIGFGKPLKTHQILVVLIVFPKSDV